MCIDGFLIGAEQAKAKKAGQRREKEKQKIKKRSLVGESGK